MIEPRLDNLSPDKLREILDDLQLSHLPVPRKNCLVGLLDANAERRQVLSQIIDQAGFELMSFKERKSLVPQRLSRTPDVLILFWDKNFLENEEVLEALGHKGQGYEPDKPHLIFLAPTEYFCEGLEFCSKGEFECLAYPMESPQQLLQSLDRFARFNNLQKRTKLIQGIDAKVFNSATAKNSIQQKVLESLADLYKQQTFDKSLNWFFNTLDQINLNPASGSADHKFGCLVFFRFVKSRRTLVAHQWRGLANDKCKDLGIDFLKHQTKVQAGDLRQPHAIELLREFASQLLGHSLGLWLPLTVGSEVVGVFLYSKTNPTAASLLDPSFLTARSAKTSSRNAPLSESFSESLPHVEFLVSALSQQLFRLELEKRVHTGQVTDPVTALLNRQALTVRLTEEVARARRVQHPLAVVVFGLDRREHLLANCETDELELVIQLLAKALQKNSRLGDGAARLNATEFAWVLPHTPVEGATLCAERLTRFIANMDLTKILGKVSSVTLSAAVVEYPRHCHDAEELLALAIDTLVQGQKLGEYKITVATPVRGFRPDFTPSAPYENGLSSAILPGAKKP